MRIAADHENHSAARRSCVLRCMERVILVWNATAVYACLVSALYRRSELLAHDAGLIGSGVFARQFSEGFSA